MKLTKPNSRHLTIAVMSWSLMACDLQGGLEKNFDSVRVGSSRADLLATMPQAPTSRTSNDFLIGDTETLEWKTWTGRKYVATLAFGHVVSKSTSYSN